MFHRIHGQFGTVGMILSIVAIVLALGGAAVAANSGKPGPRGPRGKTGKTGPAGPAGAPGTNGTNGKDGAPGAPGQAGESPTVTTLPEGNAHCSKGGIEVTLGASHSYACNGKNGQPGEPGESGKTVLSGAAAPLNTEGNEGDFYIDTTTDELFGPKGASTWPTPGTSLIGSPWTAGGTLPKGSTETGTWSSQPAANTTFALSISPISFPIPLAAPIADGSHVHFVTEEQQADSTQPTGCAGTVQAPTAAEGYLCLYQGSTISPAATTEFRVSEIRNPSPGSFGHSAGTTGALATVIFEASSPEGEQAYMDGAWAVTGE